MKPYYETDSGKLYCGDCLEVMQNIPDESVDAIVTDPPYELGFMGKAWDNTGIANNKGMWKKCLQLLKPGGYLLSFGGTRTYHRMASAIEDAGFEIRDMIEWVYGSGFPKSLNIGKALDKMQGNEREVVGKDRSGSERNCMAGDFTGGEYDLTKGTSEWEGWGTALKPAHEPICMARKPLAEKTVAENVLKYGTGGINIDESRVGTEVITTQGGDKFQGKGIYGKYATCKESYHTGRFPANLIHDNSEEVRECFPETKSGKEGTIKTNINNKDANWFRKNNTDTEERWAFGDSGNASRFFKSIIYQAKASKKERNAGCEGLEEKPVTEFSSGGFGNENKTATFPMLKNNHPTVKPIALMEYLIKMVTPKGGIVLDPYMGSGTTGVACKNLNRKFIGIEMNAEYIEIAKARIDNEREQLKLNYT